MARFAYLKEGRKPDDLYDIEMVTPDLQNKDFYCAGTNLDGEVCDATMRTSGVQSSTNFTPRFFAKTRHIEGCSCSTKKQSSSRRYTDEQFSFNEFFETIMESPDLRKEIQKEQKNQRKFPSSAKTIVKALPYKVESVYHFLKASPIDIKVGIDLTPIKILLADQRSNFIYTKGIWGIKFIECEVLKRCYNKEKQQIILSYPYGKKYENQYDIILHIDKNIRLYRFLQKKIYGSPLPVIVFSDWKSYGKKVYGEITTSEQIYISPNT